MKKNSYVIAVDFDGTCVTHDFPKVGKDIGAAHVLRRLVKEGHQLILYTMRSNCEGNSGASKEFPEVINGNFLTDAIEWFEKNNIPLWAVQTNPDQKTWTTSPKCYAQLYIDDAALGAPLIINKGLSQRPFIDWSSVEGILELDGYLTPEPGGIIEAIREDMAINNQITEPQITSEK